MNFKLDENLPLACRDLLTQWGHDADTVLMENLCGIMDKDLYQTCLQSSRNLITLDLDFANPFRFPPQTGFGLIHPSPSSADYGGDSIPFILSDTRTAASPSEWETLDRRAGENPNPRS